MEFTYNEVIMYGAIAGITLGFILGLILLIVGIKKNKKKLGVIGFFCTLGVGVISGLLSLIVAGVFFWLLFKKSTDGIPVESPNSKDPDVL